jgi:hypothetical protein
METNSPWRPNAAPKEQLRPDTRPSFVPKVQPQAMVRRETETDIIHLIRLADEVLTRTKQLLPDHLPRS